MADISEGDVLIEWPKRLKPLPKDYHVFWIECVEHYMGIGPFETESPIYSNRFDARRWCFARAAAFDHKPEA